MSGKCTLYQLSPEPMSLMECYVIKTPNDRLIVIDGGIDGYGKAADPYLPTALRAILGIGENDYFEIDAWFLSHAHVDHFGELAKMLDRYTASSNYRINNLYFDFPPIKNGWESRGGEGDYSPLDLFCGGLINYGKINSLDNYDYASLNGAVINVDSIKRGLTLEFDGVYFDILRTWDSSDAIINSTSIVFRMRYGTHSVLFLGDTYVDSGDRLLNTYGADALRAEYIQLGHHGQHGPSKEFYLSIGTQDSIRLWPSPKWVWGVYKSPHNIVCDETRSWFGLPENPDDYFAGGFDKTGRDIVSGICTAYPASPTTLSDWNSEVLAAQTAAEW